MASPSALNGGVGRKRDARSRHRDRREEKESLVVDLIDEDAELKGSLPQSSPPSEDAAMDFVVIPRPPSPLLDLPREPIAAVVVDAWDLDDPPVNSLMRRLSHFMLADGEVGEAFLLPLEVSYDTTAHPPPSVPPFTFLTPPQPESSVSPRKASGPSLPIPVDPQVTPPRVVSPLSVPPALPPVSPVSASIPISASSALPSQGIGAGSLTASERKALAEAKRQQWLKAVSLREEEKHPQSHPFPPPSVRSPSLWRGPTSTSPSPSFGSTPHVTLLPVNSASAPSVAAVPALAEMRKEKERESGWRVGVGTQKQQPQAFVWR